MKNIFFLILLLFIGNAILAQSHNKITGKNDVTDSIWFLKSKNNLARDSILITDNTGKLIQAYRPASPAGCQSGKQFGDVIWDSLLVFHSTLMDYFIGCRHFQAPTTNFTLDPAYPSNDRTDVWVVDTFGVISVLKGGISGLVPQANPISQLAVAQVVIKAGATVPFNISNIVVYKENVHPPEFTGASVMPGVVFNYPTNPYQGDSSTYVPSWVNGDIVEWQNTLTTFDFNDMAFLKFYLRQNIANTTGNINVSLKNGAASVTNAITITNGQYGYNSATIGSYQLIVIPFNDWLPINPFLFNLVQFQFTGTGSQMQFDNVILQSGGSSISTAGVITFNGRDGHVVPHHEDYKWFYDSTHLNADSTYEYHYNNGNFIDSAYRPYDLIFGSSTVTITDTSVGFRRGHVFHATGGGSVFDTAFNFIVSDSLSVPPVLPREGTIILVGTSPSGQFFGHANEPATRDSVAGTYSFQIPAEGNLLYNATSGFVSQFNAGVWVRIGRALLHQAGDNYGGTIFGSKDNFKASIISNNIERLIVGSTGLVGIGINPTAALLEVNGNILSYNDITSYGYTTTASAFRGPQISSGNSNPFYIRANGAPTIVTNTAINYAGGLAFFDAISDVQSSAKGTRPFPSMTGIDKSAMVIVGNQKAHGLGIYDNTNDELYISDSTRFNRVIKENGNGNVIIGDTVNIANTAFGVVSTTKGAIPAPRMNTAQMNALTAISGFMVYNTDSTCYCVYRGSAWRSLCGISGGSTSTLQQVLDVQSANAQLNKDDTITVNQNNLLIGDTYGGQLNGLIIGTTGTGIGTAYSSSGNNAQIKTNGDISGIGFQINATNNEGGFQYADIFGSADASGSSIGYTAITQTFNADSIRFNSTLSGAANGYVWTLANSALGTGYWAAVGGGSVNTIYTADDALTGNRVVDLATNTLQFSDGGGTSLILNPGDGRVGAATPLGKQFDINDDNDQALFQYDASHNILINSTGINVTGTLILNTIPSGASTDSILTWDAATKVVNKKSISFVNINLTGTLNGDWLRWNTSGSYFENFTPDSSTLYAWSRYGNSALSRTTNYIGSWDTSEVHINQGGTSVITIDSLRRVGIGTIDPAYPVDIQKVGSGVTAPILNIFGYSGAASANAAYIRLGKSRASALGTLTATGSADFLGAIDFQGVASTSILATPARLFVLQDGTGGLTQIPGRFAFYTGDTTGAASEKMTIKASGTVGIGVAAPAVTSLLDLTSTTKGLLIPRMTTTQQNAISSPATGLTIWNSDSLSYVFYNGTAWFKLQYAATTVTGGSITWPGTIYTSPTTGTLSGGTLTFAPALASQSAYTVLGRASGSGVPSFVTLDSNYLTGMHTQNYYDTRYAAFGGAGTGTVTSVSVTTANGVSGSVATATTTPAITLTLGAITPTTVNGNTLTTGTYTLTGGASKTLTFNNSITLTGTDATTMTFPTTTATIARTDAANTFTGTQTFSGNITYGGTIQTTTSTNSNLYVLGPTLLGAAISAASYKLTADNVQFRVGIRGSTSTVATAGTDPFGMIIGDNSYTEATSGTSLLGGGLAVATQTFTGGSGATTDFQNVYIGDKPSSTATNNYSLNTGLINDRDDLTFTTVGKGLIFKSGTGTRAGNAVLVGGTVTVTNTTVTANTLILLTRKTSGGTIGTAVTYTLSAGASFTITSDNILDTSTFTYLLTESN